jgi:hypothetical protein
MDSLTSYTGGKQPVGLIRLALNTELPSMNYFGKRDFYLSFICKRLDFCQKLVLKKCQPH